MTFVVEVKNGGRGDRTIRAYIDGKLFGDAVGTEERLRGRVRIVWTVRTGEGLKGRGYTKAEARAHLKRLATEVAEARKQRIGG